MKNNRILFLLHLPPPIHGSSMVGKWINKSKLVNVKHLILNKLNNKKNMNVYTKCNPECSKI